MTILVETIARLLLLPAFVTAVAVLVKGYAETGDGFSAGLIAAIAVLLQHVVFGYRYVEDLLPIHLARAVALIGLLLMLLVAFLPLLFARPLLTHQPAPDRFPLTLSAAQLT